MAEGNGADVGSMYGLLVEIGKAVSRHDALLERLVAAVERLDSRLIAVEQRLTALQAGMARLEATTARDMTELRQTLAAYHASVVGNGIAVSELDARMRRVEEHLGLPPFVHG